MRIFRLRTRACAFAVAALVACGAESFATTLPASKAPPATLTPEQKLFHAIYKELIETDTTNSTGDNTRAAWAMEKRLLDAGFAPGDMQIIEPFPRKGNLVARFKGSGAKKPMLLLAHLDVVEAKREDWKSDPFKLQEADGYFTARGAIDDKAMAAAFVSVLAQLKREGFKPSRDIILALTADEETGEKDGAKWLVENKIDLIKAEFGINEGVDGELRAGNPVANRVQLAEKKYASYQLESRDVGGHSSIPTRSNAIYRLAGALQRIGAYEFPVRPAAVTRTFFALSAPLATTGQLGEGMRAVGEGRLDSPAIDVLTANPYYNAQLRTTCVATMVEAGHAANALPQSAKATVNCRILPDDDPADVERQLKQLIGNDDISIRPINKILASPASPLASDVVKAAGEITRQMWDVPLIPTMSVGSSDSVHLRSAGIPMYGMSGLFVDMSDFRVHGTDERVEIARMYDAREFMYRLVKRLAQ